MSNNLTPKEIVNELDRYIVGQSDAKKSVAIALRNRWRRQNLPENLKEEVVPKNILMIGPTGVGKTEIARRLAKLAHAPFIKVEATKFTEIGYVGRDVESIIRDLVESAITMNKEQMRKKYSKKAKVLAEDKVIDALVGAKASPVTRDAFRKKLYSGELNESEVSIDVMVNNTLSMPSIDIPGAPGSQMGMMNLSDLIGGGKKQKKKTFTVKRALEVLEQQEAEKFLDEDSITDKAVSDVENHGIVFLDEIDKICIDSSNNRGNVSREGVQRDLLPLIEGTTVTTKYGSIKTDYILFIASGAFHLSKPADLLPELQGRLPIRVELQPLEQKDFVRILKEPEANLIIQYIELLKTEEFNLSFNDDAIEELAKLAVEINSNIENIGARRLHTLLEKTVRRY